MANSDAEFDCYLIKVVGRCFIRIANWFTRYNLYLYAQPTVSIGDCLINDSILWEEQTETINKTALEYYVYLSVFNIF